MRISSEVALNSYIADFERLAKLEEMPNKDRYTVNDVLELLKNIKEGKIW